MKPRRKSASSSRLKNWTSTTFALKNFPLLSKVIDSKHVNLDGLDGLQSEIECALASLSEESCCLREILYDESMPESLKRKLGLLPPLDKPDDEPIMVKSDPEKPLKLTFSQKPRDSEIQLPNLPKKFIPPAKADSILTGDATCNTLDTNPIVANYAIPNRFWALMEPYCAEITESHISYLEEVIKNYEDEANNSTLLVSPDLPNGKSVKCEHTSPDVSCAKKLKRESSRPSTPQTPNNNEKPAFDFAADSQTLNDGVGSHLAQLKVASSVVSLARKIDSDLKGNSNHFIEAGDHGLLTELAESLVADQYDESVVDLLKNRMDQFQKGGPELRSPRASPGGASPSPSRPGSPIDLVPTEAMKSIAKRWKVSSSFRIEKKVAQAVAELGLAPLNVFIQPSQALPSQPPRRLPALQGLRRAPRTRNDSLTETASPEPAATPMTNGHQEAPSTPPATVQTKRPRGRPPGSGKSSRRHSPHNNNQASRTPLTNGLPSNHDDGESQSAHDSDLCNGLVEPCSPLKSRNNSPATSLDHGSSLATQTACGGSLASPGQSNPQSPMSTALDQLLEDGEDLKTCLLDISSSMAMQNGTGAADDYGKGCLEEEISVQTSFQPPTLFLSPSAVSGSSSSAALANGASVGAGGPPLLDPYAGADEVTWALVQRQRELRMLCASNLNTFRRLFQCAKRDLQWQEIKRRLAVADADVMEAYNKLLHSKAASKPLLKRDRDAIWKCLKERRKLIAELETFEEKNPAYHQATHF